MLNINSIGIKSDLFFLESSSLFFERDGYLVVKSKANPKFFWGNFLLFKNPPKEKDFEFWIQLFHQEFSSDPKINHISLTWDIFGAKPEVEKFKEAGFQYDEIVVLTASSLNNFEKVSLPITFKKIENEIEWMQVVELQLQIGIETKNYKKESYREFLIKQYESYRQLVKEGYGHWFGAFLNGELVADLGLFGTSDFARFQSIETKQEYRGRGIARNLIKFAMESFNNQKYIIQAEHDGTAIDLYMKIGFEIKEVVGSLCLYNKNEWKN